MDLCSLHSFYIVNQLDPDNYTNTHYTIQYNIHNYPNWDYSRDVCQNNWHKELLFSNHFHTLRNIGYLRKLHNNKCIPMDRSTRHRNTQYSNIATWFQLSTMNQ